MLAKPFYHLPLRFDPKPIRSEVEALAPDLWHPDRLRVAGYASIGLITHQGRANSIRVDGPMAPTKVLAQCPAIRRLLETFDTVIGEVRLRRLGGHGEIRPHYDAGYPFFRSLRVHLPITTSPDVVFSAGSQSKHLPAGSAWVLDRRIVHSVVSTAEIDRVHLVFDTVPSVAFWDLMNRSNPRARPPIGRKTAQLQIDSQPADAILAPGEAEVFVVELLARLRADHAPPSVIGRAARVFERFVQAWRATWALVGCDINALQRYRSIAVEAHESAARIKGLQRTFGDQTTPHVFKRFTDFLDSGAFWLPRLCELLPSRDSLDSVYVLVEPTLVRVARGGVYLQHPDGTWRATDPLVISILSRLAKACRRGRLLTELPMRKTARILNELCAIGAVVQLPPWRSFAPIRQSVTPLATLNKIVVGTAKEMTLLVTNEGVAQWSKTHGRYEQVEWRAS